MSGFLLAAHSVLARSTGEGSSKRQRVDGALDGHGDPAASAAKPQASAASRRGGGEVHITLRRTPFYDSWDIDAIAAKSG